MKSATAAPLLVLVGETTPAVLLNYFRCPTNKKKLNFAKSEAQVQELKCSESNPDGYLPYRAMLNTAAVNDRFYIR